MDGQVRRVGHQGAVWAEQGAAEVQALLDVDADGCALQHPPHLLCDSHEPAPDAPLLLHVDKLVEQHHA